MGVPLKTGILGRMQNVHIDLHTMAIVASTYQQSMHLPVCKNIEHGSIQFFEFFPFSK